MIVVGTLARHNGNSVKVVAEYVQHETNERRYIVKRPDGVCMIADEDDLEPMEAPR